MNHDETLCRRIQGVKSSGIRRFFDILEETRDAISLGVRESDFVIPWHIRDAGVCSLEKSFTKYTSNADMTELCREIVACLNRRFGLQHDFARQIVVTTGGSEVIDLALRCTLNSGDEAIIPVPPFVCYGPLTSMAGGMPVYVGLKVKNGFRLTAAQLRVAPTSRTKAVMFPFPSNPTGGILERADLGAPAEVLKDTNTMVLSDEIYAELTYGQKHMSPANLPGLYDHTIVVNDFSKSHAAADWRMGYVCGPTPILRQMLKLHQLGTMFTSTANQCVAIEIMRNGDMDIERMQDEYDGRRRYLAESLHRVGLPCFEPKGTFYVFPDIRGIGPISDEFCERFLMEEKVTVISGSAFGPGDEGFICCHYTTNVEDIAEALTRMDNFLTNLRRKQAWEG